MAQPSKSYTAILVQGSSLSWRGRKFRRGVPVAIGEHEVKAYETNGRFSVQTVDLEARRKAQEDEERRGRRRSRRDVNASKAARGGEQPKPPAPSKPVSPERLLKLAEADVSAKMKRGTLENMATQMGATGPEGEAPADAQNRDVLVSWIERRQGEILAAHQGDDDPDLDDDGDDLDEGDDGDDDGDAIDPEDDDDDDEE